MPPLPGLGSVPFEHAAISQQRIEDAGEAAGEGDDSHLFATACAKEVWPSGSPFRISMARSRCLLVLRSRAALRESVDNIKPRTGPAEAQARALAQNAVTRGP